MKKYNIFNLLLFSILIALFFNVKVKAMTIDIKIGSNYSLAVQVDESNKVEDLKQKIEEKINVESEFQVLLLNELVLDNDKLVDFYNIQPNTPLTLKIKYETKYKWQRNYGGSDNDYFKSVVVTSDGGYVAVGYSKSVDILGLPALNESQFIYDAIIAKYDCFGNIIWQKNYGGVRPDYFEDIVVANDGGYIVVGRSQSSIDDLPKFSNGTENDAIIVKYDENGTIEWQKNYGGTSADYFQSITPTSSKDGYIVVGYSDSSDILGLTKISNGTDDDAIIVKYNNLGEVVWQRNFGGSADDNFYGVTSYNNEHVVVGHSKSNDIEDLTKISSASDYDAIIVKYEDDGTIKWQKNYGGNKADYFYGVVSSQSGIVVAGSSASSNIENLTKINSGTDYDGIILKYNSDGLLEWQKNYGGSKSDYFQDIALSEEGYLLVGYSLSTDISNLNRTGIGEDAIIVDFDLLGNVVTQYNYGGEELDHFYGVFSNENGYIAVGRSQSNIFEVSRATTDDEAIIVRYEKKFSIIKTNIQNGTYSVDKSSAYYNETIQLVLSPEENYELDQVKVLNSKNEEVLLLKEDENTYSFKMPTEDVEIFVSYKSNIENPKTSDNLLVYSLVNAVCFLMMNTIILKKIKILNKRGKNEIK